MQDTVINVQEKMAKRTINQLYRMKMRFKNTGKYQFTIIPVIVIACLIALPRWLKHNVDDSETIILTARLGKFEIFHSSADKHYFFRLKASNGEVILDSQGYASHQACMKGIKSVQTNASLDERYERKDEAEQWSFALKAANGEIIGKSQQYTTSGAREYGIQSVKQNAVTERIEDVIHE